MKTSRYTVKHFNVQFPDDSACLDFIFKQRYPDGGTCECGKTDCFYRVEKRRCYSCSYCGHQVSPTEGTIFHKSSTSLKTWFFAMFLMSSSKNGVAAKEIERQTGVTYKTAWRMARQIRKLMEQGGRLLSGIVEADETRVGGKSRWMHASKRMRVAPKPGGGDKMAVIGVVERGGEVRATVVPDITAGTLLANLEDKVTPGSTVYTDELRSYDLVRHIGFVHARVSHRQGEYVRAEIHTNSIEGFWSQLKRSINGTFHHVSKQHLQLYVNEFAFRYNRRKSESPMFSHLSARVAQRQETAA